MTRLVLVLACVAFLLLMLLGMWWGWRNRARRQAGLPALPPVPAGLGDELAPRLDGVYVGSTFASSWQDRVVHGGLGLQANATATLRTAGVLIEREGAETIFLPRESITGARLAPGLAGRVVGAGGLLVISWRLGSGEHSAELDTGLRADDKSAYPQWVRTINEKVAADA
ncbi:MAG TPA: transporter [Jatrophihabitantaceae bacterium]|jgi:hypothetical protein|nr:transporter [Jatrophihabitantaceae bacterium]